MPSFDPDEIARTEAEGWRAYYDRRWPRLFYLIARLSRAQFGMSWSASWQAAFQIASASKAWAPEDHDEAAVRTKLIRYFQLARQTSNWKFDPHRAANLELRYWAIHRRHSVAPTEDKSEFIDTVADLHSELFGLSREVTRESAEWRVRANNTVDSITMHRSDDPEADWCLIEEQLRNGYRSIATALCNQAKE